MEKNTAFTALILFVCYFPASAQLGMKEGKAPKKKHNSHLQQKAYEDSQSLKQQFGLSESQTSKVFNVSLDKERKLDAIKHRKDLDKAGKTQAKEVTADWYKNQLREIMTEVQFVEYKNIMHLEEE